MYQAYRGYDVSGGDINDTWEERGMGARIRRPGRMTGPKVHIWGRRLQIKERTDADKKLKNAVRDSLGRTEHP